MHMGIHWGHGIAERSVRHGYLHLGLVRGGVASPSGACGWSHKCLGVLGLVCLCVGVGVCACVRAWVGGTHVNNIHKYFSGVGLATRFRVLDL